MLDKFNKQPLLVGPTSFSPTDHIPVDRPMVVIRYSNGKPQYLSRQAPGITVTPQES